MLRLRRRVEATTTKETSVQTSANQKAFFHELSHRNGRHGGRGDFADQDCPRGVDGVGSSGRHWLALQTSAILAGASEWTEGPRRADRSGFVRHQHSRGIAGEAGFPLRQGFGTLWAESGLTHQRTHGASVRRGWKHERRRGVRVKA
jgi:hypothetical protein